MSAKGRLKGLRIKGFRGSTGDFSIAFDAKKTLALIYGENGSGKTTICDALDFIGNGKVGSLEGRGLGSLHAYWPAVGANSAAMTVELSIDATTWRTQVNAKVVTPQPATPAIPKIEVLRRSSLVRLVQEAPKERYDALKPFIDISMIEQAESALRSQVKNSRSTLNDAANRIAENHDSLERLRKESASSIVDALTWAKAVVAKPPSDTTSEVQSLRAAVSALQAVIGAAAAVTSAAQSVATSEQALHVAEANKTAASAANHSADANLVPILVAANEHFEKHGLGKSCPLCESAEKAADLAARVQQRLVALKALTEASDQVATENQRLMTRRTLLDGAKATLETAAAAAATCIQQAPESWRNAVKTSFGGVNVSALRDAEAGVLRAGCDEATRMVTDIEGRKAAYRNINTLLEQYEQNVARQATLSSVLPKLESALAVCEAKRKEFLDEILSGIAKEVGRIYEIIHPGEGLNKISIKLDPKKTGSVELAAEFLSTSDLPPHAYFSESHLDSLGLCIFLALAGRSDAANTIVVMDDVLGVLTSLMSTGSFR